ncbi:MAG: YaaC family protein [Pseudomonadota bacterium]
MVTITSVHETIPNDTDFIWRMLRRYHDVDWVGGRIRQIHSLGRNEHKENVLKQARQVKYCLKQAEEYFSAAKSVSIATQPVLLYYGVMSLAVAEYLLKSDGKSSLDANRSTHKHHGLELTDCGNTNALKSEEVATIIRAKPFISQDERRGTFELWHREAREYPIIGKRTRKYTSSTEVTTEISGYPNDRRIGEISSKGLSLADCFSALPFLAPIMYQLNLFPSYVRALNEIVEDHRTNIAILDVIIHPTDTNLVMNVADKFLFAPSEVGRVNIHEFKSGLGFRWTVSDGDRVQARLPRSISYLAEETYFYADDHNLNEFGLIYVGLYILGNLARYYPDVWMWHIEKSSALAIVSDHFFLRVNLGHRYFACPN